MNWREEVLEKARLQEEKNAAMLAVIPEKYRHYIMTMVNNTKIKNEEDKTIKSDKALIDLGCYVAGGKTYLPMKSVYFTVMGKVAQFNDWVAENGYSSKISDAQYIQVGTIHSCKKTVTVFNSQGRMIRDSSGTATVGFGRGGVDATNPLENAETSALGRALTFLGMGTQIENIASAEEMQEAERSQQPTITEEQATSLLGEMFVIQDIKDFTKDGKPVAKLGAVNQETGEPVDVWLEDNLLTQAKNSSLKSGDVIKAILIQLIGTKGPYNTFREFSIAS